MRAENKHKIVTEKHIAYTFLLLTAFKAKRNYFPRKIILGFGTQSDIQFFFFGETLVVAMKPLFQIFLRITAIIEFHISRVRPWKVIYNDLEMEKGSNCWNGHIQFLIAFLHLGAYRVVHPEHFLILPSPLGCPCGFWSWWNFHERLEIKAIQLDSGSESCGRTYKFNEKFVRARDFAEEVPWSSCVKYFLLKRLNSVQ